MSENMQQILIAFFSGVSIWAIAGTKYKRLGFIFGLFGQPFWIYATFKTGQWGMLFMSLWYTGNCIRGLWNHKI